MAFQGPLGKQKIILDVHCSVSNLLDFWESMAVSAQHCKRFHNLRMGRGEGSVLLLKFDDLCLY